jgi:hypothetical protein
MYKNFTKKLSSHSTRSSSMNFNIPSIKGWESTFYYSGIKKYLMEKLKDSYQSEFIFQ